MTWTEGWRTGRVSGEDQKWCSVFPTDLGSAIWFRGWLCYCDVMVILIFVIIWIYLLGFIYLDLLSLDLIIGGCGLVFWYGVRILLALCDIRSTYIQFRQIRSWEWRVAFLIWHMGTLDSFFSGYLLLFSLRIPVFMARTWDSWEGKWKWKNGIMHHVSIVMFQF